MGTIVSQIPVRVPNPKRPAGTRQVQSGDCPPGTLRALVTWCPVLGCPQARRTIPSGPGRASWARCRGWSRRAGQGPAATLCLPWKEPGLPCTQHPRPLGPLPLGDCSPKSQPTGPREPGAHSGRQAGERGPSKSSRSRRRSHRCLRPSGDPGPWTGPLWGFISGHVTSHLRPLR